MIVQSRPIETPATITINPGYLRAKRLLDIVFTLLLAPLIICIGLIVAICIKLDSQGPVFFRQKRVGQNGREFEMLKFRSMYRNADQITHQQNIMKYMNGEKLNEDGADNSMAYKAANDPRITRVGRFIRKTSLDEIPQFWNVLRGQMSLVGPRPPLP